VISRLLAAAEVVGSEGERVEAAEVAGQAARRQVAARAMAGAAPGVWSR